VDALARTDVRSTGTVPGVLVEIIGTGLPGRSFPCDDGSTYDNVHVGIGRPPKTTGLVAGDATEARWTIEVRVGVDQDGNIGFGGPYVYGNKGDRAIGLPWGTLDADGMFEMFRAAKLRLVDVDPALISAAERGGRLVGRLGLTDELGWPRCARPPDLRWTHEQ